MSGLDPALAALPAVLDRDLVVFEERVPGIPNSNQE